MSHGLLPLAHTLARASTPARRSPSRRGLTLIEAILLTLILGIVGVGVGTGMQSAFDFPEATERAVAVSTELKSEGENWRAVAFGASPWPSSLPYSSTDTVTLSIAGQSTTYSRTTNIQNWDPNNLVSNASPQTDFVRVQITINGVAYVIFLTSPT